MGSLDGRPKRDFFRLPAVTTASRGSSAASRARRWLEGHKVAWGGVCGPVLAGPQASADKTAAVRVEPSVVAACRNIIASPAASQACVPKGDKRNFFSGEKAQFALADPSAVVWEFLFSRPAHRGHDSRSPSLRPPKIPTGDPRMGHSLSSADYSGSCRGKSSPAALNLAFVVLCVFVRAP
ncbi:hypothetical protein MRX96_055678 [Rhipicephalus microplus]